MLPEIGTSGSKIIFCPRCSTPDSLIVHIPSLECPLNPERVKKLVEGQKSVLNFCPQCGYNLTRLLPHLGREWIEQL